MAACPSKASSDVFTSLPSCIIRASDYMLKSIPQIAITSSGVIIHPKPPPVYTSKNIISDVTLVTASCCSHQQHYSCINNVTPGSRPVQPKMGVQQMLHSNNQNISIWLSAKGTVDAYDSDSSSKYIQNRCRNFVASSMTSAPYLHQDEQLTCDDWCSTCSSSSSSDSELNVNTFPPRYIDKSNGVSPALCPNKTVNKKDCLSKLIKKKFRILKKWS